MNKSFVWTVSLAGGDILFVASSKGKALQGIIDNFNDDEHIVDISDTDDVTTTLYSDYFTYTIERFILDDFDIF